MNLYVNKLNNKVRERIISLTLIFLLTFLFLGDSWKLTANLEEEHYYLKIVHNKTQETLLQIAVSNKEIFYLQYTNSRDLNPVIDVFQVGKNGYFFLLEERYPWYGVGQEYHQEKDIIFKEDMVVVRLNKEMKILPLRVAYTVKQILKIKDKEYLLNSLAKAGEAVDLLIEKRGGQ